MQLQTVQPHPEIAPYVHQFWVFTSARGLPNDDSRVVVPNGRHKLIVPYRNGLTLQRVGAGRSMHLQHHAAGDPVLVGLWEEPSVISSSAEPTCTIGVELLPHGLTPFFPIAAHELTQQVVSLHDVLGKIGAELGERVSNASTPRIAVQLVQNFLRSRLANTPTRPRLARDALRLLEQSSYRMEISELERRMGYSRRYLHALFMRDVGLAPKRVASVLTFERIYRRFSRDKSVATLREDALDLFYDQSHFIRTFRRFTGLPPTQFAELHNEFGRIFYRSEGTTLNPA